ncbi:hypothetical protein [Paenibacillus polymyxa]|uniref:Uncharacterized protein n=1 Tax=Paenibacillus polymyxa TaxID=1406 RepID=A0AAP4EAB1_PAEPO|nr:hypothetical protein [Paenibacillus polymyxa]MDH2330516.1 hypothetical protein [Paenibacillus polymyxa]
MIGVKLLDRAGDDTDFVEFDLTVVDTWVTGTATGSLLVVFTTFLLYAAAS